MISDIDLSSETLQVGETLTFSIYGKAPIIFQIRCFVEKPAPPAYKECAECDVRQAFSGQKVKLLADPETWRTWSGRYEIVATDADGDTRRVLVPVMNDDNKSYFGWRRRGRVQIA